MKKIKSKLNLKNKLFKIVNINSIMPAIDLVTKRVIPKKPKKDWSSLSFNIKPLSVAKFFYEKGIELNSTMQDLLYLAFIEVLKKEGRFLFTEEFQAWRAGPTLGSVFLRMNNYFRQKGTYEGLFDKYPNLDNERVTKHLEKIYQQYKQHEIQKKELTFSEKAKDKSWRIVRKPLNNSFDYSLITLELLTKNYTNHNRRNARV